MKESVISPKISAGSAAGGHHAHGQKGLTVQAKLTIGSPDDHYERQAELVADQVMRMPFQTAMGGSDRAIQRKCAACEHEEEQIQRKPFNITPFIQKSGGDGGGIASDTLSSQIETSRGGGRPMAESTRSFMEARFGNDFSGINIHTDSNAIQLSQKLNAQAFTVGNDVFFNEGKYNPESEAGKHLLAHELVHTVQQSLQPSQIRKSPGSPAGGCGACFGTPRDAGAVVHSFIQEAFLTFYPNMLTEHHILSVLPEASNFSRGFLDLAVLESYDQIAIGEIKPANVNGISDGNVKLALYQTALEALGMNVRRLDYELPLTMEFPTLGFGPSCPPLQALQVFPPVNGLYTYSCEPDYSVIRSRCSCRPPNTPIVRQPVRHTVEEREGVRSEQPSRARDVAIATGGAVATVGAGYLAYRGLRMLPSLFPPLWPTIPANLAIP
jgi:hypothetical protein